MNMLGDEPPYLSVGTEVSAKYKGAFCEAKVRKVDKQVKCKVTFKLGLGTHTVLDSQIKGTLRVSAVVEAKHPEKKEVSEATIIKIQDCSQYTVVFDDGDITTLRRSALCLKSGRHFAESETLDQLPLTHPEHFGNPVVGGRRGRRRQGEDDESGDEESPRKCKQKEEKETDIGKVVCVELGDKKKAKDNWFPGLVVAPNAQDTVKIRVKEDYLVRSFKDGRYYTVPKKEANEFTREIGSKVDNNTLKTAVEKALIFIDKDELPPHWDRDLLFGLIDSDSDEDSDGSNTDTSDDEPREEKDHFVAQLYKFMDDRATPINNCPSINSRDLDLYKLFKVVHKMNGYNKVTNNNQWKIVSNKLGLGVTPSTVSQVRSAYKKYLHSFEDFYRKLGCTMVSHPRHYARNRSGRRLIRDKDRATPADSVSPKPEAKNEETVEKIAIEIKEDVVETKEDPIKKEDPTIEDKVKSEEVYESEDSNSKKSEDSDESIPRPVSSTKKKFPTLKASPRTKEDGLSTKEKRKLEPIPDERKKKLRTERMMRRRKSVDDMSVSSSVADADEEQTSQNTRSKSKDNLLPKKDTRAKKLNESEKKITSAVANKKKTESDEGPKKGRKRRNTETGGRPPKVVAEEDLNLPFIPHYKNVIVGDQVKIYYGTRGEPKIIYEAKVVDIEEDDSGEQVYLVHYNGWNSRYDEWVKRNKIAENLSWKASRTSRRSRTTPVRAIKTSAKKKPFPPKVNSDQPQRCTTPSSITSSSSRTKSPATPRQTARRTARKVGGETVVRRTRKTSVQTDLSIDSQSESDSEDSDSEEEQKKVTSEKKKPLSEKDENSGKEDTKKKGKKKIEVKGPGRRKTRKKSSDESDAEGIEDKNETLADEESEEERIPGRQIKRRGKEDVKSDGNDENIDDQKPRGRDFDLNQIRSELKGIDKAIKPATEAIKEDGKDDKKIVDSTEKVVNIEASDIEALEPPVMIEEVEKNVEKSMFDDGDDVYEFKEPEPFEFQEVRSKVRGEGLLTAEDRAKLNRRSVNRIFDEFIERTPEKIQSPKKITKSPSPSLSPNRGPSVSPNRGPSVSPSRGPSVSPSRTISPATTDKKEESRFRKTLGKKMKEIVSGERKDIEKDSPSCPVLKKTVDLEKNKEMPLMDFMKMKTPEREVPVLKRERDITTPPPLPKPKGFHVPAEMFFSNVVESKKDVEPVISSVKLSPEPPRLVPMTIGVFPTYTSPPTASPVLKRMTDVPKPRESSPEKIENREAIEARFKLTFKKPIEEECRLKATLKKPVEEENRLKANLTKSSEDESFLKSPIRKPIEDNTLLKTLKRPIEAETHSKNAVEDDSRFKPLIKKAIEDVSLVKVSLKKSLEDDSFSKTSLKKLAEEDSRIKTPVKNLAEEDSLKVPLKKSLDDDSGLNALLKKAEEDSRLKIPFKKEVDSILDVPFKKLIEDDSQMKASLKKLSEEASLKTPVKKQEDESRPKAPLKKIAEASSISASIERVVSQSSVADKKDDEDIDSLFINKIHPSTKSYKPPGLQKPRESVLPTVVNITESNLVFRSVTEMHLKTESTAKPSRVVDSDAQVAKKVCSKRKNNNKRIIISKEFVIDDSWSESDDSDEERLVIANDEESRSNDSVSTGFDALNKEGLSTSAIEERKRSPLADVRLKRVEEKKSSTITDTTKKSVLEETTNKKRSLGVFESTSTSTSEEETKYTIKEEEETNKKADDEERENCLKSLLCEEIIPGSPAPQPEVKELAEPEYSKSTSKVMIVEIPYHANIPTSSNRDNPVVFHQPPGGSRRDGNDAAVVMDNTPPTTPESNLSTISGSPREERVGSSSLDNESSKSQRDSSEIDMDNDDHRPRGLLYNRKADKNDESPKKRRRNRKRSENENCKRFGLRLPVGRPPKHKDNVSDSDEDSHLSLHHLSSGSLLMSRSPRPSKYNFFCDLDPELDANQRISVLQQKLQDLRKTYTNVKSELAAIDRRRKKLRRREREEKAAAITAAAAAARSAAENPSQ